MSDREFESELKKLNIAYSDESSVSHRTRKYLTNLSFIVADVWRLCNAAEYCREVIDGESQDPLPDIGRLIHPGEDANRNCICVYMRKLGAQMINYGEGSCLTSSSSALHKPRRRFSQSSNSSSETGVSYARN